MNRLDRIQRIMDLLEERGNVSTAFLAGTFNVSESSVRRDINHMTTLRICKNVQRVHGGIILDRAAKRGEYMFELKLELQRELKVSIARKAIEFVHDGDSIIIDSGSTCLYFAQLLHNKRMLKVITTDVMIAQELGKHDNIESSIIGGIIRPGYYTLGGTAAVENIDRFRADKVFLSADAVDLDHGITNASDFEVGVKRRILQAGNKVYVVADHTKFNKQTLYKVAELSEEYTIITDKELDPVLASTIRDRGIELHLA